jgi:alkyl sulfatase BDS1-like metallo-beta-lactamase superfamily hydrolase
MIKKQNIVVFILFCLAMLTACDNQTNDIVKDNNSHSAPTIVTIDKNNDVYQQLPFEDKLDFVQASRGMIAHANNVEIKTSDGTTIWDTAAYQFVNNKAPESVNPSLWRQEKLNNIRGLFKVTDDVYQVRGFDFANMTIIVGKTGWIIVDPLTSIETSKAALAFAKLHLTPKPIKAIILTHAHIDHFGGIGGLVSAQQIKQQNIRVIAPSGFMEAATSENILVGMAMARRSGFMYGKDLPRSARGHIGSGLGTGPAYGNFSLIEPTEIITKTGMTKTIDGVEFVFQNAPGSESPAELTFYLPQLNAFCGAELVSRNMHNLYTLRGAQVRNAQHWSQYINNALDLFGHADVYFGSHHWPIWGNDDVKVFLEKQRDLYQYIHDQTVRMINLGLTANEIAEEIRLPDALGQYFYNRGYYGTLSHNAKAVYQFYMGWYDANPANLNPLPDEQSAGDYVKLMGGADTVLKKSQQYFNDGNYRFAAELLNKLVFADSDNQSARELLAQTYEQLGYQSEAGSWRNVYLSGAKELRDGPTKKRIELINMIDILSNTPIEKFFETLAVRLKGDDADGVDLTIKLEFTDLYKKYTLRVNNSVLHQATKIEGETANASLKLTHPLFIKILTGQVNAKDLLLSDDLVIEGSRLDLLHFLSLFEQPTADFNIVTP